MRFTDAWNIDRPPLISDIIGPPCRLGQRQMLLGGLVVCSLGTVAFGFVGQTTSYFAFVTSCFILRLIEGEKTAP